MEAGLLVSQPIGLSPGQEPEVKAASTGRLLLAGQISHASHDTRTARPVVFTLLFTSQANESRCWKLWTGGNPALWANYIVHPNQGD